MNSPYLDPTIANGNAGLPWPPVDGSGYPSPNSGRSNKPIQLVVLHSAVMRCQPGMARVLARLNRDVTHRGSWHYAVDPSETIQCSYDSWVCWHAPPNSGTLGIEMADLPERGRAGLARWDQLPHRQMLHRAAFLTATLCIAYRLPVRFVGPIRQRLGVRGITTHRARSIAYRQSSHWDLGAWPRRRFLRLVDHYVAVIRAEGADARPHVPAV